MQQSIILKYLMEAIGSILRVLRRYRGFTLVELLIAMAIFGTLVGIATPYYATYRGKAQVARAVADMRIIADEILSHMIITGDLPDSLAQLNLDRMRDPWGRPYQYLRIEGGDPKNKAKPRKDRFLVPVNTDFDLYSMGPDGLSVAPFTAEESRDDIVRANNGGFYGEAALF